jgi:hypothetical protein
MTDLPHERESLARLKPEHGDTAAAIRVVLPSPRNLVAWSASVSFRSS